MRYITTVRGRLKDADEKQAQMAHDNAVEKLSAISRPMGAVGHRAYLNPQDRRQFQAVDTWESLEGLDKFMHDPNVAAEFGKVFDGQPEVTVWVESGWSGF